MEITANTIVERVMTKYKIIYDIAKGYMTGEQAISEEHIIKLIDAEVLVIQRENAEDALLAEHEVMWDEATDRFRVTFKSDGKVFRRIMTRGQFKRFFDTKLKSLGV